MSGFSTHQSYAVLRPSRGIDINTYSTLEELVRHQLYVLAASWSGDHGKLSILCAEVIEAVKRDWDDAA